MKNFNLLLLSIITFSMVSCASSGYVYLDYPQEPEMVLSKDIDDIAIVNRSLTKEEDNSNRTLESIATGEIIGSDKLASDEAIKGVFDGFQNRSPIRLVIPSKTRLYGTGTRQTPEVLSWDKVNEICDESEADALLVLETFDSNSDFVINTAIEQVTSVLQTGKASGQIPSRARVNIKSYWRLYDPASKTIIDQFQQTHLMDFNLANGAIPVNALPETAYASGMDYTSRFFPSFYRVRRDMYKKGKGRDKRIFDAAWRRTEVANWKEAIEIWTEIADDRSSKSAGRAAYNIAVAHEVLGNTDLALKWAQRSYEDYGDKLGRDYAKVLLRRKRWDP
ncbi:DUF6340 family protein [Flagellimonas lutimaris]|uniref:DUF6340 family protein n=1 Tax=Flagellimonas lutimaris TaxID=475082 RepID=UPI003F5CCF5A